MTRRACTCSSHSAAESASRSRTATARGMVRPADSRSRRSERYRSASMCQGMRAAAWVRRCAGIANRSGERW